MLDHSGNHDQSRVTRSLANEIYKAMPEGYRERMDSDLTKENYIEQLPINDFAWNEFTYTSAQIKRRLLTDSSLRGALSLHIKVEQDTDIIPL